jgi:hypothetical protein
MRCNPLIPLTAAILAATVGLAQAKDCAGVTFPDQAQVAGSSLTLNGLGLRQATFLKVSVYVAALYVAQPGTDAKALLESETPKQLTLQFVRAVDSDELVEAWAEGFEHNAKAQLPALKDRITKLEGWMTDVEVGDRLSFTYTPGSGLEVSVKGTAKGVIEGPDFTKAFFSIWLGNNPPNPGIRTGLLGGACD